MAQAQPRIRLSQLFRDPELRRVFERAERDGGTACAVQPVEPVLSGGASLELEGGVNG